MKRRLVGIALFCLILLTAIFAGYWDMLNTEKTRIASETTTSPSEPAGALVAENPAGQAPPETASGPAASDTAPTFDVLRVEPDGSTIMAGKAAAGTTVRLTDGTSILGEEKVGPGGDFAIVLDNPLPTGEHQIRIEARGEDGVAATSRETAIVSVPERGRENELLALVETPDRPSRLISVPKGEEPGVPQDKAPQAEAAAAPPAAAAGPSATPPGLPDMATPAMPGSNEPAGRSSEAGTAATGPSVAAPASPLAVEAVEIEDETIYVAGRAPVGPTIRVYVDNVFLAEDAGRTSDRFLVSTKSPVAPGDHMVRADQIGADGSVLARVEVPFVKPEGRSMSAIADAGVAVGKPPVGDGAAPAPAPAPAPASTSPGGPAAIVSGDLPASVESIPSSNILGEGSSPAPTTSTAATADGAPSDLQNTEHSPTLDAANGTEADPTSSDMAAARQAPLQAAGARVIIRRGDTLWRISREAYGRGARYTTIYLANGDQIRNPDRIYPGQVFRMPEAEAR